MSKMMRLVVRRGGRRVVCFRRRPQVRRVSSESLWPVEPIKAPVSEQVRELAEARSGALVCGRRREPRAAGVMNRS